MNTTFNFLNSYTNFSCNVLAQRDRDKIEKINILPNLKHRFTKLPCALRSPYWTSIVHKDIQLSIREKIITDFAFFNVDKENITNIT